MSCLFDYTELGVEGVVVCGDIHGEFEKLVHKLCVEHSFKNTLLIVAGDCGFGFFSLLYYDMVYQRVSRRLAKSNNYVAFVRGNHDNPFYFNGEVVCYKRWRAVPDYSMIRACGHNILCVGGAISPDRVDRIEGKDWWPNEAPFMDRGEIITIPDFTPVDTVVSHSAPSFCRISTLDGIMGRCVKDSCLTDAISAERAVMDEVFSTLRDFGHPVKSWFYGHFHQHWQETFGDTTFYLLDVMEFREL